MLENLEERIIAFFKEKKRFKTPDRDDDLFRGGYVDSLFALEMVGYLEREFDIKIKNRDITEDNFRSVRAMAELVLRILGKDGAGR